MDHAAAAPLSPTQRTRLRRERQRGRTDRADLYSVLDAGLICHLGVVVDGYPTVVPTSYGRAGDTLYLHGSVAARSLAAAGDGVPVCVTVTLLDGIVLARSIFNHSINYRSAMIYGTAHAVEGEQARLHALRVLSEHLAPGQWNAVRRPTPKELAATTVLELPLAESSVKIRAGGPEDEDADYELPIWAGVLPLRRIWGAPEPDTRLAPGIPVPAHIRDRAARPVG